MKFTLPDKFCVRTPTVELYKLVQIRLFELGFEWSGRQGVIEELRYGKSQTIGVYNKVMGYANDRNFYSERAEVSIADLFLAEIPKKETVIDILPWKVVVREESADIGCRKDIALSFFKTMMEAIETPEGISLDGYEVQAGRRGFKADGKSVSWETWDEFVKAFNTITKKD